MKIYKHQPLYLIQLTFRRGDDKIVYLTLCETDIAETKQLLNELFPATNKTDIRQLKTRIEIQERIGGKNGKYTAVSYYGYSPALTRQKLINYLKKYKPSN